MNTCVGCGTVIPEGQQVCPICEDIIDKFNERKKEVNIKTTHPMKLVRDKIPEIIAREGKIVSFRALNDEEYVQALHRKLDEEVAEFHQSGSIEELADILEVINALSPAGISDVEIRRIGKRTQRGGFDKRYFVTEISEVEG